MNKQILLACVLVGTFILPANAIARKHDSDGYKPKNSVEKAERRKKRKARKAGKKTKLNKKKLAGVNKQKSSVEKAERSKSRKAKKAGKKTRLNKKKNTGVNKANRNKKKTKKVVRKQQKIKRVSKPYLVTTHKKKRYQKKRKNKKLKRLIKNTFDLLANEAYGGKHYVKPRHYINHGFERANRYCLPKRKVFRRLRRVGWRHIEIINQGPERARLRATDPYNNRYKLVVHKCSGSIIRRKPIFY